MFTREVDVWVADISAVEIDEDLLSVSELGLALSIGLSDRLSNYLAAQTWLRRQLSRYLDVPAEEIRFESDDQGRPRVVAPDTDLTFSLSSSGWAAALIVGFRKAVGIDVETVAGASVEPKVIARTLTPAETESYSCAIDPVRTFLRFRVRKDSLAKASGVVVDEGTEPVDVSGVCPIEIDGFEIIDVNLGEELVAAVAVPPQTKLNLKLDDSMHAPVAARSFRQPAAVAG